MPSSPLTVGKLIGRTLGMYRTHFGIFLRTTAIFYIPLAALAFFFARGVFGGIVFSIVIVPVQAIAHLAIISHCVESLHGRPLAIRTAIINSLRRLLVYFGIVVASTAVLAGIFIVLAIAVLITLLATDFPLTVFRLGPSTESALLKGLLATDFPLTVFRDVFTTSIPAEDIDAQARQIESIMNVIDRAIPGLLGFSLAGVLCFIVFIYMGARWLIAGVALMVEGTGPIESLSRSWDLSRSFVLRTVGYLLLLSVIAGVFAGLLSVFLGFGLPTLLPGLDQKLLDGLNRSIGILASIFIMPFSTTAYVLYYFDLRVRKEKYDYGGIKP